MAECKSRKCKQAAECSCHHVYSDGSEMSGTGNLGDPVVVQQANITCVKLSDGTELIPDANGCVKVPNYVQSLHLDGYGDFTPDANGLIYVPDIDTVDSFNITILGDTKTVNKGDTVKIVPDGTNLTYANRERVEFESGADTSIALPTLKHTITSGTESLTLMIIGANNYFSSDNTDLTRDKGTDFLFDILLDMQWQSPNQNYNDPFLPVILEFDVEMAYQDPDNGVTGAVEEVGKFWWNGELGRSWHSFNFNTQLFLDGFATTNSFGQINLKLISASHVPQNGSIVTLNQPLEVRWQIVKSWV